MQQANLGTTANTSLPPQQAIYDPAIFNVGSIEQAKQIILTPQGGMSPEQRWATETPYFLSLIEQSIKLTDKSIVLDYGCGIGRMAKALIDKHHCRVVGVDISPSMRALAAAYVSSERFFCCAPEAMYWLGVRFDAALAIWILQHCHQVKEDIARIKQALVWRGKLFVVNDQRRIVPTKNGWVDDGQNIRALLNGGQFSEQTVGELDPTIVGQGPAQSSYMAVFQAEG